MRLLGKLPYERMMAYTRNADLGLTLDKDTNLNYRFSLPNKLFDYLHAGISGIGHGPAGGGGIVREFDCGVVLKQAEPGAIVQAVQQLLADPARISALRANATFAARKLDGEKRKPRSCDRSWSTLAEPHLHIVSFDVPWPADYGG